MTCNCGKAWSSILPPDPCYVHAQAYNGLCYCRGLLNPHPFHAPSILWTEWTTDTLTAPVKEYVGKHRKPE